MISQDTLSRTLAAILASALAGPSSSFAWGSSSASSSGHSASLYAGLGSKSGQHVKPVKAVKGAPAHTSGHSVTAKPSHLRHWPTAPKQ